MSHPGVLVLSFDLELAWGLRCYSRVWDHEKDAADVRVIVSRLLDILVRYDISSTWATVGHLMLSERFSDWDRLRPHSPKYDWFDGQWYDNIPEHHSQEAGGYYAPDLVAKIVSCPVYQELACHTFSHIEVGHAACSGDLLREELKICQELAHKYGRQLKSIVFPRNWGGHLEVIEELGFRCYRGPDSEWYWFGLPMQFRMIERMPLLQKPIPLVMRAARYLAEKARHRPPVNPVRHVARLWEIPDSMFFPGLSATSRWVSPSDCWRRGIKGLDEAVRCGQTMSIYTHPHNFLTATEELLSAYDKLCRRAAELRDCGKLRILPMGQVAEELDNGDETISIWRRHDG